MVVARTNLLQQIIIYHNILRHNTIYCYIRYCTSSSTYNAGTAACFKHPVGSARPYSPSRTLAVDQRGTLLFLRSAKISAILKGTQILLNSYERYATAGSAGGLGSKEQAAPFGRRYLVARPLARVIRLASFCLPFLRLVYRGFPT